MSPPPAPPPAAAAAAGPRPWSSCDFVTGRFLGAGKFGRCIAARVVDAVAWTATDDRQCVLKLLSKTQLARAGLSATQERDVHRACCEGNPAHVAPLLGRVETDWQLFLVLPHYGGGNLFEWPKGARARRAIGTPAHEAAVRRWTGQLLLAVHTCHQRNTMHRDLKPENVVLDAQRTTATLIDFVRATQKESDACVCGTVDYSPPQMVQAPLDGGEAQTYTKACDMWSIGVLVYEFAGR